MTSNSFSCSLCSQTVEPSRICFNYSLAPNGLVICYDCHFSKCFFCYKNSRVQKNPPCCSNCSKLIKPDSKPSPFFHPIGQCAVWTGYSCSLLFTKTLSIKCPPHEKCGLCLELRDWSLCRVHNNNCVKCNLKPINTDMRQLANLLHVKVKNIIEPLCSKHVGRYLCDSSSYVYSLVCKKPVDLRRSTLIKNTNDYLNKVHLL